MPSLDNPLKRLQDEIVDRLKGHDDLGAVDIYPETVGDLNSQLEISLGKLGIVLVVQTAAAGISNVTLSKPVFDSNTFTVEVWEDVTLNRSLAALDAAIAVVERLYQYRIRSVDSFKNKLILPAVAPNTMRAAVDGENNGYYVNFTIGKAE